MAQPSQYGAFVNSTYIWDVQELYQTDVTSPEFKELLVRMYQNINAISLVLNVKDTGMYETMEFVNGQTYFSNPKLNSSTPQTAQPRQVFRTVINFGTLPNTTTKSVAHNISTNAAMTFTRIYGAASDTSGKNYIPLPYASPTSANNIELSVTSSNVVVTTGSNRSNFNVCYIVLEYLKS